MAADEPNAPAAGSGSSDSEGGGWQLPLPSAKVGAERKDDWKWGFGSKKEETGTGLRQKNADKEAWSKSRQIELGPIYKLPKTPKQGKEDKTYVESNVEDHQVELGSIGYDFEKKKATATVIDAKFEWTGVHGKWDIADTLNLNDGKGYGVSYAPFAARLGDRTVHGTSLFPGSASPNVRIGGKPAWRTRVDFHVCPRSHPPHVGGVVVKGAPTVFINHQMACRAGDVVVEAAGGNNPIATGCSTVWLGQAAPPARQRGKVDLSIEGKFVTVEAELQGKGEIDLKTGEAELMAKAGFKAALATAKAEGIRHIPIPFTDYNVAVGGSAEASVLTVAAEGEAALNINHTDPATGKKKLFEAKLGATVGAALFGGGFRFSFGVEKD